MITVQFTDIISVGENEHRKTEIAKQQENSFHSSSTSNNLHSRNNVQRRKRKGEEIRNPYIAIHCQLLNMQPSYLERHPKITGVTSFAFSTKATRLQNKIPQHVHMFGSSIKGADPTRFRWSRSLHFPLLRSVPFPEIFASLRRCRCWCCHRRKRTC